MNKTGRLLVVVALTLAVGLLGAPPAMAHNVLTGSEPADEESMAQGPPEVTLTFLSSLDPANSTLLVTGPGGDSVISDDAEFDGSRVTVPVETGQAGDYQVDYEVLSSDGHWVSGTIEFTVTEGEAPPPTTPPAPEPAPTTAAAAAAEPSPEPVAAASDEPGGSGWIWLLVAAVLLAGAGAGYLVYRRRTT